MVRQTALDCVSLTTQVATSTTVVRPYTPQCVARNTKCVSALGVRDGPATTVNTNHKHVSTVKKMLVFFSRRREKQQFAVACATVRGVTAVTSPCGPPHF